MSMAAETALGQFQEVYVPHLGWLMHAAGEEVARSLDEGWFEYREQAFCWLYLPEGATVIDCGAHVGLFSTLAGRLVGSEGRVIAVDPHPQTSGILERNLRAHQLANRRVVRVAVGDRCATAMFSLGRAGRAAYSSLLAIEDADERVEVAVTTLDELAASHALQEVDLLKLDIEGVEIEALAGARRLLSEARVKVLMIEFGEQNLNRGAHTTTDLRDAITGAGYGLYRLNDDDLALEPAVVSDPIVYENLFAVRDSAEAVNARLREAAADRRRVAEQIIRRGRASTNLYGAAASVVPLRRHLAESVARLMEQERQLETSAARLHESEHQLAESTALVQEQAVRFQEQGRMIESLEVQLKTSRERETKVRQDYDRIRNSLSWRYTRPLRGLADLVVRQQRR